VRMTSRGPACVRLGVRVSWRSQVAGGRGDAQTRRSRPISGVLRASGLLLDSVAPPAGPLAPPLSLKDDTVACAESRTHAGPPGAPGPRGGRFAVCASGRRSRERARRGVVCVHAEGVARVGDGTLRARARRCACVCVCVCARGGRCSSGVWNAQGEGEALCVCTRRVLLEWGVECSGARRCVCARGGDCSSGVWNAQGEGEALCVCTRRALLEWGVERSGRGRSFMCACVVCAWGLFAGVGNE
jgi:hypothetical protein